MRGFSRFRVLTISWLFCVLMTTGCGRWYKRMPSQISTEVPKSVPDLPRLPPLDGAMNHDPLASDPASPTLALAKSEAGLDGGKVSLDPLMDPGQSPVDPSQSVPMLDPGQSPVDPSQGIPTFDPKSLPPLPPLPALTEVNNPAPTKDPVKSASETSSPSMSFFVPKISTGSATIHVGPTDRSAHMPPPSAAYSDAEISGIAQDLDRVGPGRFRVDLSEIADLADSQARYTAYAALADQIRSRLQDDVTQELQGIRYRLAANVDDRRDVVETLRARLNGMDSTSIHRDLADLHAEVVQHMQEAFKDTAELSIDSDGLAQTG